MDINEQEDESLKRKLQGNESVNKKLKENQHHRTVSGHQKYDDEPGSDEKLSRYVKAGSTMIIWMDY